MERRLVIKQVLILAGGLVLLPSCLRDEGKSTLALKTISITLVQEKLLGEIAEAILPRTDSPGAKELNLHLFVLKMVDDCLHPEQQQVFIQGLQAFSDWVRDRSGHSFEELSSSGKQQILTTMERDRKSDGSSASFFYATMKERTIDGYLNSQYVMTRLIVYELVPGRYNGYFPVKSA